MEMTHLVGLTRRWAKDFGAEASEVKARSGHGHHLDGAAGQAKAERPDGAFARPVHGFVERREDDAFVFQEIAEVVGLCECDVFAECCAHRVPSDVFSHSRALETNRQIWAVIDFTAGRSIALPKAAPR
jgi:hypothetical protein